MCKILKKICFYLFLSLILSLPALATTRALKSPGHPQDFQWSQIQAEKKEIAPSEVLQLEEQKPEPKIEALPSKNYEDAETWLDLQKFPHLSASLPIQTEKEQFWMLTQLSKKQEPISEFVIFDHEGQIRYLGNISEHGYLHGLYVDIPKKREGNLHVSLFQEGHFIADVDYQSFQYEDEEQVLYQTFRPVQYRQAYLPSNRIEIYTNHKNFAYQKIAHQNLPLGRLEIRFSPEEKKTVADKAAGALRPLEPNEIKTYESEFSGVQKYVSKIMKAPFDFGKLGPKEDLRGNSFISPFLKYPALTKIPQKYLQIKLAEHKVTPSQINPLSIKPLTNEFTGQGLLTEEGRYLMDN